MHRSGPASLVVVLALGICACGGSTSAPRVPPPGTSRAAPQALLRQAASAMAALRGVHVVGVQHRHGYDEWVSGTIARNGDADFYFKSRGRLWELLVTGGEGFIRGNETWWREQRGWRPYARRTAGRWMRQSPRTAAKMARFLRAYRPRRFARCLVQPVQGLRSRGTTAVGGRPAVVVTAGGHRPDTLSLSIAAEGSPVLLRAVERGPVSPASGADRACGRQRANHWEYRFSQFDELASISRPSGPIYGNPEGFRRRGRVT